MDGPKPLALVFGWGGSTPGQLRAYARLYARLGFDTDLRIGNVLRGLLVPGGRESEARAVAREVVASQARASRPIVVHALSDNGFLSLAALLEILPASAPGRRARRAPGRRPRLGAGPLGRAGAASSRSPSRAGHAGAAQGPGRRESLEHPVLTPVLRAGFGVYSLAFPSNVRRMVASGERVLGALPRVPVALLYGDADRLVPPASVEAFETRLRERGFVVRARKFPGSTHVAHFVRDPAAYEATVPDHLRAAGLPVRSATPQRDRNAPRIDPPREPTP